MLDSNNNLERIAHGEPVNQDERGRFVPGNTLHRKSTGRGVPWQRAMAKYRRAIFRAESPEDAVRVLQQVKAIALGETTNEQGETVPLDVRPREQVAAATLYLNYLAGQPRPVEAEPDRVPHFEFVFNNDNRAVDVARKLVANLRGTQT